MIEAWKQTRRAAVKRAQSRRSRKAGYSLMEILIVLAIMGLLVALVGPKLASLFGGAQSNAATAQIKTIKEALNAMNLNIGRYPTQQEGLSLLESAPGGGVANWNGPYLNSGIPNDPWGKPYVYTAPGDNEEPKVSTLGKDGKPGGSGANADITA